MSREHDLATLVTLLGLLIGGVFLFAPVDTSAPPAAASVRVAMTDSAPLTRVNADSLAEDIILYNLFSPARTPPSRRVDGIASGASGAGDDPAAGSGGGFVPTLHGTVIADGAGASRALLQLQPSDAGPRLYGVGEGAGGYRVVSIDPRAVTLAGPRGRLTVRLPQEREDET